MAYLLDLEARLNCFYEKYEKSIKIKFKELELADNNNQKINIYTFISNLYRNKNDYRKAALYLSKAFELVNKSKDIEIYDMLTADIMMLEVLMKKYDIAINYYEKHAEYCLKNNLDKNPFILNTIALAYYYLGDFVKALKFATETARIISKEEKPHEILSMIYSNRASLNSFASNDLKSSTFSPIPI